MEGLASPWRRQILRMRFKKARSKTGKWWAQNARFSALGLGLALKSQKQEILKANANPEVENSFLGSLATWGGKEATSCG